MLISLWMHFWWRAVLIAPLLSGHLAPLPLSYWKYLCPSLQVPSHWLYYRISVHIRRGWLCFFTGRLMLSSTEQNTITSPSIYPSPRNDYCKYPVTCFKSFFFLNKRKLTNSEYVPIVFPCLITNVMIYHVDPSCPPVLLFSYISMNTIHYCLCFFHFHKWYHGMYYSAACFFWFAIIIHLY